jgi:hypothetical protein
MKRSFAAYALMVAVPVLASVATPVSASSDYTGEYRLLRDTELYPKPQMNVRPVATLPAGSTVTLSGKQESVLAEAVDSKGRRGWVSIQDIAWSR